MAVQAEWLERDYYAVLGVPESATQKDIQRAYRLLARQYHPDANAGAPDAEERFKEISAAYDVLGDPDKRMDYDQVRRLGPMAGPAPSAGWGGFAGFGGFPTGDAFGFDLGGLGSLFGATFPSTNRPRRPRGRRGRDLDAELHIDFVDAVRGLTTELPITSDVVCSSCEGHGTRAGTPPATCLTCVGSGQVVQAEGPFAIRQVCPACRGRGQVVTDPCELCGGTGRRRQARRVTVRLPAGVDDGQRIRVPDQGEPGRSGGRPGDLYVVVRVAPHPSFGRHRADLTLRLPVTYPEAVLGAEVTVPTLDGEPVTVRIPPGTPSGQVLRVEGRGVRRPGGGRGDLLVTVEIAVPSHLDADARRAVEGLARKLPGDVREHLRA